MFKVRFGRLGVRSLVLLLGLAMLIFGLAVAQDGGGPPQRMTAREEVEECMGCHDPEVEAGPPVKLATFEHSQHRDLRCTSCHVSITETPHTEEMVAAKAACGDCHEGEASQFAASVHARPDKVAGDHPTCSTCHASGDPHAVKPYSEWTRQERAAVCATCHSDKERMARYDVDPEAVASYEASFHGRALLRFASAETAYCADCHTSHDVKDHGDPAAATSTENLARTCAKCHPGAGQNFAISGASHMNLSIEREPILRGVLWFFKILVTGMSVFLLGGVLLDVRRAAFGKTPPRAGRAIGILVSLGFLSIIGAIIQATFQLPGVLYTISVAAALLGTSMFIHYRKESRKPKDPLLVIDRFHRSLRIQHMVLTVSFVVLVATGMPLRNAESDFLRNFYFLIGGLDVARFLHRVAGVALIGVFLFHLAELLVKWKREGFAIRSLTMLPSKQDVRDFVAESKNYLGLTDDRPRYGRFHFREKLDYFAEYWGIPLMAITGLILWYPVAFGNLLPPMTIPIAFIAHSYEAVLAFLAILTWHMYNSFFNPDHFMSAPPWKIGYMKAEDLAHKHPEEYESRMGRSAAAPEPEPESEPEPADSAQQPPEPDDVDEQAEPKDKE